MDLGKDIKSSEGSSFHSSSLAVSYADSCEFLFVRLWMCTWNRNGLTLQWWHYHRCFFSFTYSSSHLLHEDMNWLDPEDISFSSYVSVDKL
jgi:hypothetical protein